MPVGLLIALTRMVCMETKSTTCNEVSVTELVCAAVNEKLNALNDSAKMFFVVFDFISECI